MKKMQTTEKEEQHIKKEEDTLRQNMYRTLTTQQLKEQMTQFNKGWQKTGINISLKKIW